VQNRSDNADRWLAGSVVHLGSRSLTVESVRQHGARLLVTFVGVIDRAAAEQLKGELTVPVSALPELPEGEYWPHQLEGCRVVTESGRALGALTEVIHNPANDLWVAIDETGEETLVPAIRQIVAEVDVDGRRIVVRDLPGLTAPDKKHSGRPSG
jgi:16S rRNA processing protein RimM